MTLTLPLPLTNLGHDSIVLRPARQAGRRYVVRTCLALFVPLCGRSGIGYSIHEFWIVTALIGTMTCGIWATRL